MEMRAQDTNRVLTLPLRVNTNVPFDNVPEDVVPIYEDGPQHHSRPQSDIVGLLDWSAQKTSVQPPASKRLSRPHIPAPILTRSPIRKMVRFCIPPPPKYHVTVTRSDWQNLSPTSAHRRLQYLNSINHLCAPLVPLISVSNGLPHPAFPTNLLQYHLLTHEQLDSLARWYHQVEPPVAETFMYPTWIPPWTSLRPNAAVAAPDDMLGRAKWSKHGVPVDADLETKRRRWGRFIGLRGCESPNVTGPEGERPEELTRRMEREWKRALERAEEEGRAWEKGWRGRW